MQTHKVICAAALLLAGAVAPALANGIMYDCEISKGGKVGTWIGTRIVLLIEQDGTARAVDGVTLAFVKGGTAKARVRRSGQKLIFHWNVAGAVDSRQQTIPTFSYRATLVEKTGAMKVVAKPARFPQSMSGSGKCTQRDNIGARDLQRLLRK